MKSYVKFHLNEASSKGEYIATLQVDGKKFNLESNRKANILRIIDEENRSVTYYISPYGEEFLESWDEKLLEEIDSWSREVWFSIEIGLTNILNAN